MTRVLRSRMKPKFHVRFCNGGGAGDRPADRTLGGLSIKRGSALKQLGEGTGKPRSRRPVYYVMVKA